MLLTEVRKARRVCRLSGIEVGNMIGIRPQTLYRYESGDRKLPVPVAKKLGDLYGVPWERFYDDDGQASIR